ncbi:hypothetical protein D3C75_1184590 [compost metagenome]
MESTLAGCASDLFSETTAAAAYCAIMNPDCSPPLFVKNGGSPSFKCGLTSRSILRSAISASSAAQTDRWSIGSATGWPWKFPPEITRSSSAKISGLSVAELISIFSFSTI